MNKKIFQLVFFLILLIAFAVIIKNYVDSIESDISDYALVLESVPKGEISRLSPIIIKLAQDVDAQQYPQNTPLTTDILKFQPEIEGYTYFTDKQTIEFHPNEPLQPGTLYSAKLYLKKLFPDQPYKPFHFRFSTPSLTFKVKIGETVYYDSTGIKIPYIKGHITFNDYIDFEKKQQLIRATQDNQKLSIEVMPGKNNLASEFIIKGIKRTTDNEVVKISWSGKPIFSNIMDSTQIIIPAIDSFEISGARFVYFPKPLLTIKFTDSIDKKSFNDSSLFIDDYNDYNININHNEIKVIFNSVTNATHTLRLVRGLQSITGKSLNQPFDFPFTLASSKPLIALTDSSNYIPSSLRSNMLDVNVLNLKSIDIDITFVPDKNMIQFLQVNDIEGHNEIDRVGTLIYHHTFNLQNDINYSPNQLSSYNLNLLGADLSRNGLYNFSFTYYPENVVYHNQNISDSVVGQVQTHPFRHNIIFSNLLGVARLTTLDSLYIFVSDLSTGKPVKAARVDIYNFQQNKLGTLLTDENGMGKIKITRKNLFIKIQRNNDITYLKLNEGDKLISGKNPRPGVYSLKGYRCHVEGLKPEYTPTDSINLAVIISKTGRQSKIKEPLEIKLESPGHFFFNNQIIPVGSSSLTLYRTTLPENCMQGDWKIIIANKDAEFEANFRVKSKNELLLPIHYYFDQSKLILKLETGPKSTFLNKHSVFSNIIAELSSPEKNYPGFKFTFPNTMEKPLTYTEKSSFDKKGKALVKLPKDIKPGMICRVTSYADFPDGIKLECDSVFIIPSINNYLGIKSNFIDDTTLSINLLAINGYFDPVSDKVPVQIKISPFSDADSLFQNILLDTIITVTGRMNLNLHHKLFKENALWIKAIELISNKEVSTVQEKALKINSPSNIIHIVTDRNSYTVGDSCYMEINSDKPICALRSIETDTRILNSKWISCNTNPKGSKIAITDDMIPGFYISFIDVTDQENKLSSRYIKVNSKAYTGSHNIEVDIPHDWVPMQENSIVISNKSDNAIKYYITMGNYDSLPNKGLSANEYFKLKPRYQTQNWISNYINTNQNKNNLLHTTPNVANISGNKTNIIYGPFLLAVNQKTISQFTLPFVCGDFIIKITCLDPSNGEVFEIQKEASVSTLITVDLELPKYLNAGDIIKFPVYLTNNTNRTDTLKLQIKNRTSIDFLSDFPDETIIKSHSRLPVWLAVKTKESNDLAKFEISVHWRSGNLNQKISIPINHDPGYLIHSSSTLLNPQEKWQQTITPMGIKGTNEAVLETSNQKIPTIWEKLQYLNERNDKNLENLLNKTFPLIYLAEITDQNDLKKIYTSRIKTALDKLPGFQTRNGGFKKNISDEEPDNRITSYAGEFMLCAKENEMVLNEGVFNKWQRYQQIEFQRQKYEETTEDKNYAILVYTLGLAKTLQAKQLTNYTPHDTESELLLACTYSILGKTRQAKTLVNIDSLMQNLNKMTLTECSALLNLITISGEPEKVRPLVTQINNRLRISTLSPGEITLALNSMLKSVIRFSKPSTGHLIYKVNNGKEYDYSFSKPLWYLNIPIEFTLPKNIDIINTGIDTLCLNLSYKGYPQHIDNKENTIRSIKVSNHYTDLNNSPLNTDKIQSDDYYKQKLTIKNSDRLALRKLLITIPVPSGVSLISVNNASANQNVETERALTKQVELNPGEEFNLILVYRTCYKGVFISYPVIIQNLNEISSKSFIQAPVFTIN